MFPSSIDPLKRRKGSQNTFVSSNQVDLTSKEVQYDSGHFCGKDREKCFE